MPTTKSLQAWHLTFLYIILSSSCTLILSYNIFSLCYFIILQNIFYYFPTFLYCLYTYLTFTDLFSATQHFLLWHYLFPFIFFFSLLLFTTPYFSQLSFLIWTIYNKRKFSYFTLVSIISTTRLKNQHLQVPISPFLLPLRYTLFLVANYFGIKLILINIVY